MAATLVLYTLLNIISEELHIFPRSVKILLQNPILSAASVTMTSQVCESAMLLLLIEEIKKYEIWMASNGLTFIPNFVKIGQLNVETHADNTRSCNCTSLLKEGRNWAIN
jgi:hypothetical protein